MVDDVFYQNEKKRREEAAARTQELGTAGRACLSRTQWEEALPTQLWGNLQ